jgi:exopolyphosphatase/guanosine-5'-triphosphate,3'-diphosphate pyrophosphatase
MIAVIDLGTNTFNLVVGERNSFSKRIIYSRSMGVGLGKNGIQAGMLTQDAMERGWHALALLQQDAQKFTHEPILAVGTSALRNAHNVKDFAAGMQTQLGIQLHLIDGDEEARLIWEGVRASGALDDGTQLVVDIGGGSVECIIGNDRQLFWKKSFEIGMARMLALFPLEEPVQPEKLALIDTWLRENLHPLFDTLQKFNVKRLVGSAGSFDTLSTIDASHKGESYLHGRQLFWEIPQADFRQLYQQILSASFEERLAMPGMLPIRAEMIVYAAVLIRLLADKLNTPNIVCSHYALREGILFAGL